MSIEDLGAKPPQAEALGQEAARAAERLNLLQEAISSARPINWNGSLYRPTIIGAERTQIEWPQDLTTEQKTCLQVAVGLIELCQLDVQQMTDRLWDSLDGSTLQGVEAILKNHDLLSDQFSSKMRDYLLGVVKNGDTVMLTKSAVLIPPCSRNELEGEIAKLPVAAAPQCGWSAWLDHMYDPIPDATQGFYIFETRQDRENFHKSLGPEFVQAADELREIFDRSIGNPLDQTDEKRYEDLSRKLVRLQKERLDPIVAADEDAKALSTRVTVRVNAEGAIQLTSSHYTEIFEESLTRIAHSLRLASDIAKMAGDRVGQFTNCLAAYANWCEDRSRNPNWGGIIPEWVAANQASNVLDLNFCAEEKYSRIGSKGVFQFILSQHVPPPEPIQEFCAQIDSAARERGTNVVCLNLIHGGGKTSSYPAAGEKLPDPHGLSAYKFQTWLNMSIRDSIAVNGEEIKAACGLSGEGLALLQNIPAAWVYSHEYGHTRGLHSNFLGSRASDVEESGAQSSAMFQFATLGPEHLEAAAIYGATWMPIRRARQGATESHSRSDIAMFKEYLDAGAVTFENKDGRTSLKVVDAQLVAETAFRAALKYRFWELGLPEYMHEQYVAEFNPSDSRQYDQLIENAKKSMEGLSPAERTLLENQTKAEVAVYYDDDRLIDISKLLDGVIAGMPESQSVVFILDDWRIRQLLLDEAA